MKVVFSHGKESGPWGSKIKRLAHLAAGHGCGVESIDYTDIHDPELRVERLVNALKQQQEDLLLVGSSMGGYASLVASERVNVKGVFLLAPALFIEGYKQQTFRCTAETEIVHGWSDEVIPPDNSIRFAGTAGCALHLIPGDHRLNSSIERVEALFLQFLLSKIS